METKHTPGPWHVGGYASDIVYAADGFAIANAETFHGQPRPAEANARLIAAAPELLGVVQRYSAGMPWEQLFPLAKAAMAKATIAEVVTA